MDDWRVLLLGLVAGGDQTFGRQDAEELLSQVDLSFTLTLAGESMKLDTIRTAVKPVLLWESFGWDNVSWFQEGSILPPNRLGVGEYTLTVLCEVNGWSFPLTSQFYIDPSDSSTCIE